MDPNELIYQKLGVPACPGIPLNRAYFAVDAIAAMQDKLVHLERELKRYKKAGRQRRKRRLRRAGK